MPLWHEHKRYCTQHGIKERVCNFANKLIDKPEKYLPEILANPRLKELISKKLGFTLQEIDQIIQQTKTINLIKEKKMCNFCEFKDCKFRDSEFIYNLKKIIKESSFWIRSDPEYKVILSFKRNKFGLKFKFDETAAWLLPLLADWFGKYRKKCPIIRYQYDSLYEAFPYAITHSILHTYTQGNKAIEIVKEVARYYYGEEGVRAVELHLKLDEFNHILNALKQLIPAYIVKNLRLGKTIVDPRTMTDYNPAAFIRKYIYKDPHYILKIIKDINIRSYTTLMTNLERLSFMTVGEFLKEYGYAYSGYLKDYLIADILKDNKDAFGELTDLILSLRRK